MNITVNLYIKSNINIIFFTFDSRKVIVILLLHSTNIIIYLYFYCCLKILRFLVK